MGIFYLVDFGAVVLYDQRVETLTLYAGAGFLSVSVLCCLYCVIYLSWYQRIDSDHWEQHNVFVIPVATACGVIGCGLVTRALWPVWGVFTFPIVGSQFTGVVIIIAMLPDIV